MFVRAYTRILVVHVRPFRGMCRRTSSRGFCACVFVLFKKRALVHSRGCSGARVLDWPAFGERIRFPGHFKFPRWSKPQGWRLRWVDVEVEISGGSPLGRGPIDVRVEVRLGAEIDSAIVDALA